MAWSRTRTLEAGRVITLGDKHVTLMSVTLSLFYKNLFYSADSQSEFFKRCDPFYKRQQLIFPTSHVYPSTIQSISQ